MLMCNSRNRCPFVVKVKVNLNTCYTASCIGCPSRFSSVSLFLSLVATQLEFRKAKAYSNLFQFQRLVFQELYSPMLFNNRWLRNRHLNSITTRPEHTLESCHCLFYVIKTLTCSNFCIRVV